MVSSAERRSLRNSQNIKVKVAGGHIWSLLAGMAVVTLVWIFISMENSSSTSVAKALLPEIDYSSHKQPGTVSELYIAKYC
jgi:hypothetical protein